jgi:hypothetical protein
MGTGHCLDQWRQINRGKWKAYHCEICKAPYNLIQIRPTFWQYFYTKCTFLEKVTYVVAIACVAISVYTAYKDYIADVEKDPRIRTKSLLFLVLHYHMRGFPLRSKLILYFCLFVFVYGKYCLFDQWRTSNAREVVLSKKQNILSNTNKTKKQNS